MYPPFCKARQCLLCCIVAALLTAQITIVRKRVLSFIDFPKILSKDRNGLLQYVMKDGNSMTGLGFVLHILFQVWKVIFCPLL